jgi:hypothetical protein
VTGSDGVPLGLGSGASVRVVWVCAVVYLHFLVQLDIALWQLPMPPTYVRGKGGLVVSVDEAAGPPHSGNHQQHHHPVAAAPSFARVCLCMCVCVCVCVCGFVLRHQRLCASCTH